MMKSHVFLSCSYQFPMIFLPFPMILPHPMDFPSHKTPAPPIIFRTFRVSSWVITATLAAKKGLKTYNNGIVMEYGPSIYIYIYVHIYIYIYIMILHCTVVCCIKLYHIILHYIILYHIIIILYYIILYHVIIILYYICIYHYIIFKNIYIILYIIILYSII